MNTNTHKGFNGLVLLVVFVLLITGCAKFENREFLVDKPQSILDQEALDALGELKSYVTYSNQPSFTLGAEISLNDIRNNSLLYRLVQKQFDQLGLGSVLSHLNSVQADGSIVLTDLESALAANDTTGTDAYVGHLVWHQNQRSAYLNSLIADIVLPGESGSDVVVDFESNNLGDTYPTTTSDVEAYVINDPDGKSGKVLRVVRTTGTAYPQFQITLPEGRQLKHYTTVQVDFKGGTCCGYFGFGMQMAISSSLGNVGTVGYASPSSFGFPADVWGRGLITLSLANLNLPESLKEANTFVLTLGSGTGAADYLLDNITMNWNIPGETIVKTPEEKAAIIRGELDKWLKAVAEAANGGASSWSVVYQPMDDNNPSEIRTGVGTTVPANTFYWQDYLGKDYAAIAINLFRQYYGNNVKLFITETNLIGNTAKIQGLKDFITYTESKGAQVDGIATELALDLNTNKSQVEAMLSALAGTGKLIKISAVDIGVGVTVSLANNDLYESQAEMYKWFVDAYYRLIPPAQRAGIIFKSPMDRATSSNWRPGEPVGLWTTQYLRKKAYAGVVEALEANKGK
ncbi:hypothetical protein PIECOFPK_00705 [Mycovorax composti]|uniref:GH10 domain-containing protein n=1 Tax=Mycovorax composti TaxID=2962693 RepID=A0ABZ2EHK8_9BACT